MKMHCVESRGVIGRLYDDWQIRRLREAYTRVSGWHSPLPGFHGFVAETQWGLENLDAARRRRADDAVLFTVLGGKVIVYTIRFLAGLAPRLMARLFTRLTPWCFYFLIGPNCRNGPLTIAIPACRFESNGGRPVCLEVCKAPVERFFAWMRVPLHLTPDLDSHHCDWRYGA